MPALLRDIDTLAAILRQFGGRTIWHSLAFKLNYLAWQARYRHVERDAAPAEQPTPLPAPLCKLPFAARPRFLGALAGWQWVTAEGEHGGHPRGLDLRCAGGTLRIEFLADGMARVRLSRSSRFPAIHSYAVEDRWIRQAGPPAAPLAALALDEDGAPGGGLRLAGPGLVVHITRRPCRLAFAMPAGQELCADADGAGWQGQGVVCTQRLAADQELYGLGEKASGLNHRGRRLRLWNRDPSGYGPLADPLYASIPFLVGRRGGLAFGILFDNTYQAEFDLGQAAGDLLRYTAAGGELCYFVLAGPDLADVLQRYTDLTGHMGLPPRWALGYHQSRWSYASEGEVREVATELRGRSIPCDAIHLDIDHLRGFRVFTWDPARFPDPARLLAGLRRQGLRTVTIQDPGVKVDPQYPVCAEGLARDAFCRTPDGRLLAGPVWPGQCYFPDFSSAAVREWWGGHYAPLIEAGVAGFWNDMNEPAVFFASTFPDAVRHQAGAQPADHAEIHNVYGQLMARAGFEALRRLQPDERPLLISRAAYAGIQRYACTWTGDNQSTWEHLRLSIPMVLNLGLSGQPFAGPDTGGFAGDCSGELLARWTQLGALLPLFRNHSALGTARQEPWAFGEPYEGICRRYIELRYRLLPYIYTAFWQAAERGLPVARPLALAFPADGNVGSMDDEYLCGDALLVAPVMRPGATQRAVYFPAGAWYDFWTGECITGPTWRDVAAPLDTLPLYARDGSVIPLGPVMQYSDEFVPERLELHVFAGDGAGAGEGFGGGLLYEDDGHSQAYRQGSRRLTRFTLDLAPGRLALERSWQGHYEPGYTGYDLLVWGRADRAPAGAHGGQEQPWARVDGSPVSVTRAASANGPLRIAAADFGYVELEW